MLHPLKILFCVNQGAGPKSSIDWEERIGGNFREGMHQPIVHLFQEKHRAEELRGLLALHRPDRVVAVGGDGTVNLVASVVGGTGMPMGIIPAGSANGMATDLGVPTDIGQALDLVSTVAPRPVDAILLNGEHLCVHLSDLGMNARLIKYFDETAARGMFTYARLSLKVLLRLERMRVTVKTQGTEIRRGAFMVVLANARKYGTGATINKEGRINDGWLEVVLVRRFGLRELWHSLSARKRFDPKRIEVVQAQEVQVHVRRPIHFQVDGDHKGRIRSVHAKVLPGHLQLLYSDQNIT